MKELYMAILDCKPAHRFVEQHDVFFGIASNLVDLKPAILDFWPDGVLGLHIDAYRKVSNVDNFEIKVIERDNSVSDNEFNLYFLNLGGYKFADMEEYHYKQLVVAKSMEEAITLATANSFWKHHDSPHVDNKYGIDIDDAYLVEEMLPIEVRRKFSIQISTSTRQLQEDEISVGYLELGKLI
jgi:hypothetical protein